MKAGPIATDAPFVAQRLKECLPQRDTTIFHSVMRINVQIAFAAQSKIDNRMLCKQGQHVVEKGNSRRNRTSSRPVKVQCECDTSFFGDARYLGAALFHGVAVKQSRQRKQSPNASRLRRIAHFPFDLVNSVLDHLGLGRDILKLTEVIDRLFIMALRQFHPRQATQNLAQKEFIR